MQWVVNLCVVIHLNGRSRDSLERQGANKKKKNRALLDSYCWLIHDTSTSWYFTGVAISRYLSYCCFNQSHLSFFVSWAVQRLWAYVHTSSLAFVKRVGDGSMHRCNVWCVLIGLWPKKQPLHRAEPRPWWSLIGQVRIGAARQTPKSLPGFRYCTANAKSLWWFVES